MTRAETLNAFEQLRCQLTADLDLVKGRKPPADQLLSLQTSHDAMIDWLKQSSEAAERGPDPPDSGWIGFEETMKALNELRNQILGKSAAVPLGVCRYVGGVPA